MGTTAAILFIKSLSLGEPVPMESRLHTDPEVMLPEMVKVKYVHHMIMRAITQVRLILLSTSLY